ncbi:hypothetical protein PG988_002462 [Apiospora saccharicola]
MQFTSFASMVVVVAAAAFVQAGPISGATDAAAADGAGSLLLTARDPKCQTDPLLFFLLVAAIVALRAAAAGVAARPDLKTIPYMATYLYGLEEGLRQDHSHPESTEKQEKHIMQFVTFASMAAIMAAALVQASPLTTMDERSPNFKGSHCMIMASCCKSGEK